MTGTRKPAFNQDAWLRRVWPYCAVLATGGVLWSVTWGAVTDSIPVSAGYELVGSTGALITLDLILGVASVVMLPLRRGRALLVAGLVSAMLSISAFAGGSAILAVCYLATISRWTSIVAVGGIWTLAVVLNTMLISPRLGGATSPSELAVVVALALLLYVGLVVAGQYRRARHETVNLLRERADSAERERERQIASAREAERMRIAREMHDVLAHRISLVSMHAGALAFRQDLPAGQLAQAADVVQSNAALAMRELREILGILRSDDNNELRAPQPTLADLPRLLRETRESGSTIDVQFEGFPAPAGRPVLADRHMAQSRTAYRVLQEGLTNARKHARGQPVRIWLRRDSALLRIEVRNPVPQGASTAHDAGMGLIGLAERVELVGGHLEAGQLEEGTFVLRAWMTLS